MKLIEYLRLAINNKLCEDIKWYFSLFGSHGKNYKDAFLEITEFQRFVLINGERHQLDYNRPLDQPALTIFDVVIIEPGYLKCIDVKTKTTVGLLIANFICIEFPFAGKIKYINKQFTAGDIEKMIPNMLREKEITIPDYLTFTDTVAFMLPLNKLFTYSSTIKTITSPPGLKEKKKEIISKYNKEYGPEWNNDPILAIKFQKEINEFDKEYYSDDPSYGITMSGKVVNNARPRQYSAFGVEYGFDQTGKNAIFIQNSLLDGIPDDPELLAALFNSARAASYLRGNETKIAGTMAKDMLRPTNSLSIDDDDCGTKLGRTVNITKRTAYRYDGSYYLENGVTKFMEKGSDFIGKTMVIRSPQYCLSDDNVYCKKCMTKILGEIPNGISLLMIQGGGIALNAKMKGMHQATKQTIKFNILDAIK